MRLIVFADIHGNSVALEELIEMLPGIDYDRIVFLGDVFGYYYHQEECLSILHSIPNLIWLKGNHDSYAVEAYRGERDSAELIANYGHSYDGLPSRFNEDEIGKLDAKKPSELFERDGKKIACFHGRPSEPLEGRVYPDTDLPDLEFSPYDVVFLGHTHCKMDRRVGQTRVMSPGSLGQPRDGKGYGFLIYDTETDTCEFRNVKVDRRLLADEIQQYDKGLEKLMNVLDREKE